jgi:hypothetical protein
VVPNQPCARESHDCGHDGREHNHRIEAPDYAERRTATARWQRSILIIAALSALSWAALLLIVIGVIPAL